MLEKLAEVFGVELRVELQPVVCHRCGKPVCASCGTQWFMRWFCAECLVEQKAKLSERADQEAGWNELYEVRK